MEDVRENVQALVEAYRSRCLWFLRPDYMPATREAILQTLEYIERYGDRAAFERAEAIKAWLQQDSKAAS